MQEDRQQIVAPSAPSSAAPVSPLHVTGITPPVPSQPPTFQQSYGVTGYGRDVSYALLIAAGCVYAVDLLLLGMSYLTSNAAFAELLANATFFVGLLGAGLIGAGLVQSTLSSLDHHQGHSNKMMRVSFILLILSIITGLLTLIPGLVLLILSAKKPIEEGAPISPKKRIFLGIGVFLGAGIPGLIISFIIYEITSLRACELSSSKCL